MTNVSKPKLHDKKYTEAYRQFMNIISALKLSNSEYFMSGLLTESEQIMLVKRMASIFMFEEGKAPYTVASRTGISVSTAQRIYSQYLDGKFVKLISCVPQKQKNEFLDLLKDFTLSAGSSKARSRLLKRTLH